MSIFSGSIISASPKSLSACITQDQVSCELWTWCNLLETFGKIIMWITIIIGAIISFTFLGNDGGFIAFIVVLLLTGLIAFIEYITYHLIALLIGAFASIVHNTRISANVALYTANADTENAPDNAPNFSSKEKNDPLENLIKNSTNTSKAEWRCKYCGTVNSLSTPYCKNCGKYK